MDDERTTLTDEEMTTFGGEDELSPTGDADADDTDADCDEQEADADQV